jgi:hypothetical protein
MLLVSYYFELSLTNCAYRFNVGLLLLTIQPIKFFNFLANSLNSFGIISLIKRLVVTGTNKLFGIHRFINKSSG